MRHTGASGSLRCSSTHRLELGRLAMPCVLADAFSQSCPGKSVAFGVRVRPFPACRPNNGVAVVELGCGSGRSRRLGGGRTTLETPPRVSLRMSLVENKFSKVQSYFVRADARVGVSYRKHAGRVQELCPEPARPQSQGPFRPKLRPDPYTGRSSGHQQATQPSPPLASFHHPHPPTPPPRWVSNGASTHDIGLQ